MVSEQVSVSPLPSYNTIFKKSFRIPFLGRQCVEVNVLSEVLSHVKMSGYITFEETVKYSIDSVGNLKLEFSDRTKNLFKKHKTKFVEAVYTNGNVIFLLRPPFYMRNVRITLIQSIY